MAIQLFEHNERAYNSVCRMLEKKGKAAVIHPTGTGKSYIAFQLCIMNPQKRFLWISPNEYIYKNQIKSLRDNFGVKLDNVNFCTYTWLVNHELDMLDMFEYLILDEFHRAGAEKWGIKVQELMKKNPDAKVLGLTATNIRYLDNQRDMADEIFQNAIASYMDLSEAIAKGILPIPKYVISVYEYENLLIEYQNRIDKMNNDIRKKTAEELLEELRRKLQNAIGVEKILEKHIINTTGKYIVFCRNKNHMFEMISKVPQWFKNIDNRVHVYHMYDNYYYSDKEFEMFLNDDSMHIKLMFSIEMLNEGVHIEGVDGVILLRPTASPILYKQQIGRALSVSGNKTPIIFDFVNNFDSLNYIDLLREQVYKYQNEGQNISEEYDDTYFEICDEILDARIIFKQLQQNLSITWDDYYKKLCIYAENNNTADVCRSYVTADGIKLGRWLHSQKTLYKSGELNKVKIQKLEAVGVNWPVGYEDRFLYAFSKLEEYYRLHNNSNCAYSYVTEDGFQLGQWCIRIRKKYKDGKLDADIIEKLNRLSFVWDIFEYKWENGYKHACEYYMKHGSINVTCDCKCDDGFPLGNWIIVQKKNYNAGIPALTQERIERLNQLNIRWAEKQDVKLAIFINSYKKYVKENNSTDIRDSYIDGDGIRLGAWVHAQRKLYWNNKLSDQRIKLLKEFQFDFGEPKSYWEKMYNIARKYYMENGHLYIKGSYMGISCEAMKVWTLKQLNEYRADDHGKLTEEQVRLLEEIKIWNRTSFEYRWLIGYQEAIKYYEKNGNLSVKTKYKTDEGYALGTWISNQKSRKKQNKLSHEQIEKLEKLGICWYTE